MRTLIRSIVPNRWHFAEQVRVEISQRAGGKVISGPFAGMHYASESRGSVYTPKILGTYELELRAVLERTLPQPFDVAIVAGAAEGYYAVGFALHSRAAQIVAFEPDASARALLLEMARSNGVADRIRLCGICDIPALRGALAGARSALVFVDIEGGETILLDPAVVPGLERAQIIVEVHEWAVPGARALLERRFAKTHDIAHIAIQPRLARDYPLQSDSMLNRLRRGAAIQVMSECRPPNMSWLAMSPRAERE